MQWSVCNMMQPRCPQNSLAFLSRRSHFRDSNSGRVVWMEARAELRVVFVTCPWCHDPVFFLHSSICILCGFEMVRFNVFQWPGICSFTKSVRINIFVFVIQAWRNQMKCDLWCRSRKKSPLVILPWRKNGLPRKDVLHGMAIKMFLLLGVINRWCQHTGCLEVSLTSQQVTNVVYFEGLNRERWRRKFCDSHGFWDSIVLLLVLRKQTEE